MPRSQYRHPSANSVAAGIIGYKNLDRLRLQTAVSVEQVHNGQRAYLLIENVRLSSAHPTCTTPANRASLNVSLTEGTRMFLEYDIKNTGQTPAHNIRAFGRFDVGPKPPPLEVVYDTAFDGVRGYSSTCGYYEGSRFARITRARTFAL